MYLTKSRCLFYIARRGWEFFGRVCAESIASFTYGSQSQLRRSFYSSSRDFWLKAHLSDCINVFFAFTSCPPPFPGMQGVYLHNLLNGRSVGLRSSSHSRFLSFPQCSGHLPVLTTTSTILPGFVLLFAWTFFSKRYDFFREHFKKTGLKMFRFRLLQVSSYSWRRPLCGIA